MITVDENISKNIGESISRITIKSDWETPSDDELEYERMLAFIGTVICQQINWDFLDAALRKIPKERFNSRDLAEIKSEEIAELLKEYRKPDNIMADERAKMIRCFCNVLNEKCGGLVENLLKQSNYSAAKLRENLEQFTVFSEDPVKKKLNVLIQLLSRTKLVDFIDMDKINPAIDYHLIRMALRTGRIEINNEELKNKIISQTDISEEEDTVIRETVSNVFKITAAASGKTIPELNLLEWHLARSICIRDEPRCEFKENPLDGILGFELNGKCPLFDTCKKRKEYKREPKFKSTYY